MSSHLADEYYPFDAGAGQFSSEAQWRKMWALLTPGVVVGVDNELSPFGDSTGLHIKVMTGQVNIKGHTGAITAQFTSADVSSVAGLTAGLKRIDRYVARADFVNNLVEFDWLTGTPNASPAIPALTQSTSTVWEIGIAHTKQMTSADATLAVGDVVDERTWISSMPSPSRQIGSEAFTSWTPIVGGGFALGNGTVLGRYRKWGRHISLRGSFTYGTTSTAGASMTIGGFPFAPVNFEGDGWVRAIDASTSKRSPGRILLGTGSLTATLYCTAFLGSSGTVFLADIDTNNPMTPAVGDIYTFGIDYETAT